MDVAGSDRVDEKSHSKLCHAVLKFAQVGGGNRKERTGFGWRRGPARIDECAHHRAETKTKREAKYAGQQDVLHVRSLRCHGMRDRQGMVATT